MLADPGEGQVVRPEIMTPLGDAMRLVDRHQAHGGPLEAAEKLVERKSLGRDVQQVETARCKLAEHVQPLAFGLRAVEVRGRDAVPPRAVHLVLHQGNERAYNHARARQQAGGELVAQRLAPAGGHHRKHVAAIENRTHRFALTGKEGVVPENGAQRLVNPRVVDPRALGQRHGRRGYPRRRAGHPIR